MNVFQVVGAGAVVLVLAGCGVSVSPAGPASPSAAPQTTAGTTPASTSPSEVPTPTVVVDTPSVPTAGSTGSGQASAPAADPKDLPEDFPLPDGARLDSVAKDGSREIAATLTVADAGKAFAFWREGLGRNGYRVVDAQGGFGAYEIRFSGHGCGGDSQVAITGTRAAVQCDLT